MAHSVIVLLLLATSIADTLAQGGQGGFGGDQGGFGGGQGGFGGDQGGFGGGQGGFGGGQGGFGGGQGGFGGDQGGFGGGQGGFGGGQGGFGGDQGGFGGGAGGFGGGAGGFGGGTFGPGGPGGLGGPFGGFGGQGGFPGFPGMFPNFGQNAFQQPQILTCVGSNEALDQLKITIRPEPNTNFPLPQMDQRREFQSQTWRISAIYVPSGSVGRLSPAGTASLVGQFYMAVTRYGRTDGSCSGLGGILQNEDTINGGNAFQNNPYLQAMRNQQFGQPAGYIADPMIIGPGGNVYSGVVRDVTEIDLRGRGVVLCLDSMCQKPTTTCCTLAKDSVPATEQFGSPIGTTGVGGLVTGLSGGSSAGGARLASASSSGLF